MTERFEHLFGLPENLYAVESPIIVVAGALLKDKHSGKVLVQLKFKNISKYIVKALKIQLTAYDAMGEVIEGFREYQYLDLQVTPGKIFGVNKAIIMPKAETRSFMIQAIKVALNNGSVQSISMPLAPLPKPESLNAILKQSEVLKQFRIEINEKATYSPQEVNNIWRCSCGEWNGTDTCSGCEMSKQQLFSVYDIDTLIEKTQRRLQKEMTEQKAREELNRLSTPKEGKAFAKNKGKRLLLWITLYILLFCVTFAITRFIITA